MRSRAQPGTTTRETVMTKSAKDLMSEASRDIETLSGEEAARLVSHPDVVFVDVREGEELQKTGMVRGAVHVPRGVLEFQADPTSPTHKPELGSSKRLVLYCGSGSR
jgi:rhodanese-related sulfurtransferase